MPDRSSDVLYLGAPEPDGTRWRTLCSDDRVMPGPALPASFELMSVRGDFFYGVVRDSLDVPTVAALEVALGPRPGRP